MIVVDTGVLYALADRDDAHHAACVRWLASARRPLIVPPLVIAEACYLIGRHLGPVPEAAFLDAFGPGHAFALGTLLEPDLTRMQHSSASTPTCPSAAPTPPSSRRPNAWVLLTSRLSTDVTSASFDHDMARPSPSSRRSAQPP